MFAQRLERLRERIHHACQRCRRSPDTVTLVGVTKGVGAEVVREAVALGLYELGENRVQEARAKQVALALPAGRVRWHLIGHLQRNKAREAVASFEVIHSVDSLRLIEELKRHAAEQGKRVEVLVQVNVSGEATKSGCRPEDADALAEAVRQHRHLALSGLMTMAPYADDPEAARPVFRRLRELRDRLQARLAQPLRLSMGMSHDVEVAIEEGADLIRIGTALFGSRT